MTAVACVVKPGRWQRSSPEARRKRIEANQRWRKKNRDKVRAFGRKYYHAKSDACRAASRRYHDEQRTNPAYLRRMASRNKAARDANPEAHFYARLRVVYGLTRTQYDEMLVKQGGVCAACERPEKVKMRGKLKRLSVDHCHRSGRVRGLLCAGCNAGIGHFRDDPALLRKVATWLESLQ